MKAATPREIDRMGHEQRIALLREYYNGRRIAANTLPYWRATAAGPAPGTSPDATFATRQRLLFEGLANLAKLAEGTPALIDEVEILKAEMFTLTKAVHSLVVTATEPEDGQVRVDAAEYDRLAEVLDALHGG